MLYWDKKAVKFKTLNFPCWIGKDLPLGLKDSQKDNTSKARIYPTSSTYENMRLSSKTTSTLAQLGSAIATVKCELWSFNI